MLTKGVEAISMFDENVMKTDSPGLANEGETFTSVSAGILSSTFTPVITELILPIVLGLVLESIIVPPRLIDVFMLLSLFTIVSLETQLTKLLIVFDIRLSRLPGVPVFAFVELLSITEFLISFEIKFERSVLFTVFMQFANWSRSMTPFEELLMILLMMLLLLKFVSLIEIVFRLLLMELRRLLILMIGMLETILFSILKRHLAVEFASMLTSLIVKFPLPESVRLLNPVTFELPGRFIVPFVMLFKTLIEPLPFVLIFPFELLIVIRPLPLLVMVEPLPALVIIIVPVPLTISEPLPLKLFMVSGMVELFVIVDPEYIEFILIEPLP